MTRIPINPELLTWARERAGLDTLALSGRFPKLSEWEAGELQPTLRQLEDFARAVHVAVGLLFLPAPPDEPLPIPDLRTVGNRELKRPSPNLLDTIYICQQRQDWFRDYARIHSLPALDFIGTARVQNSPLEVAEAMRQTLALSMAERLRCPTWTDALRQLIGKAEDAGVLVMASGVVGSNSRRKLDVGEFRGFALCDDLAPLVFLNGADSKAAQMFTLAHELAHLWLGESGISDASVSQVPNQRIERWCNQVAAELLMPMREVRARHQADLPVPQEMQRLAREFKVSSVVALLRLFDAGFIDSATLWGHYRGEQARLRDLERRDGGGGDFYRSLSARTGRRFARAVVSSTLEGQTLFQDAFRMLGMRKTSTFHEAARELGVLG